MSQDNSSHPARVNHLVLVGLMGSGKTTIGRRVATETGRQFFDTDIMVEDDCGLKVRQIFTQWGEPEFRRLEHVALLTALAAHQPAVIAAAAVVSFAGGRWCLKPAEPRGSSPGRDRRSRRSFFG